MSIVLRSRKTLAQRYRGVLKKYSTSHLWDFGVAQGPLAYAATHTAAEFVAAYPLWHLYQDAAGTVPACKINDPVGLCLDQGGGSVVLGAELAPSLVASPNWVLDSGVTVASGSMVFARGAAGGAVWNSALLTIGKTYKVTFTISNYVSGAFRPTTQGGAVTGLFSTNGTFTEYFIAVNNVGLLWYTGSSGLYATISNTSVREVIGAHASQATTTKRALLDADGSSVFDGIDDVLTTTTGGASSTSVFLCMAFNTSRSGSAQTLWSDRTGNTGLKLEITAANALVLSGGNGSAIVTATGGTVTANAPHIATAKYDGTTLSVQLDSGTVATAACALSAGTAVVTIGKDNGAVTAPYKGVLRQCTYIKDSLPTAGEQLLIRQATAASIGVTL